MPKLCQCRVIVGQERRRRALATQTGRTNLLFDDDYHQRHVWQGRFAKYGVRFLASDEIARELSTFPLPNPLPLARGGKAAPAVLRVNALATFSLRWLLPRLAQFRDRHPEIEVRLSTSTEPVDALSDPYDLIIRGGPDTFYGFTCYPFLVERRLPVCSPAVLERLPLHEVADLQSHTLIHASTLPRVWPDWLAAAGTPDLQAVASLTLDHFYLTVQAALDGLGVAMGPSALVADDLAAGRLVAPFPSVTLPSRGYHVYLPDVPAGDSSAMSFCQWLQGIGNKDTNTAR